MPTIAELRATHNTAKAARVTLENEYAGIDALISTAIKAANSTNLATHRARKAELPGLLIDAALAETTARRALVAAEITAADAARATADAALATKKAEIATTRAQHAAAIKALEAELPALEKTAHETYSEGRRVRDFNGEGEAAFTALLNKLAVATAA